MEKDILELNSDYPFDRLEEFLVSRGLLQYDDDATIDATSLENTIHSVLLASSGNYTFRNGERYCSSYYCRSTQDLFLLTKFYFKDATIRDYYVALVNLLKEHRILSWICRDVHRRVYRAYTGEGCFNSAPLDEYGIVFPNTLHSNNSMYGTTNNSDHLYPVII